MSFLNGPSFHLESRFTPMNCTVCRFFEDLYMYSDDHERIHPWEDLSFVQCAKFPNPSRFSKMKYEIQSNFLIPCSEFVHDLEKDSIVVCDEMNRSVLFRLYRRIKQAGDESGLDSIIYDLVCRVCEIDKRGYLFKVCVNRVSMQTGVSKEAIFRCIMNMVETEILLRFERQEGVYLVPPPSVLSIAEVLQIGKVMA